MDGMLGCSSPDLATPSAPRPSVRSSLLPSATILAHCCDKHAYSTLGRACLRDLTMRQQCQCRAPTRDGGKQMRASARGCKQTEMTALPVNERHNLGD